MKKIRVLHPMMHLPKVKKRHLRSTLIVVIFAGLAAHEFIPAYEHIAALAANLLFFYEPTIEA